MGMIIIIRIYALVMIVSYTTASVSSNKWVLDKDFENNLDTSQLFWEKDGISSLGCGALCNSNMSCRSFFYHPSLTKCLGSQSYKRGLPFGQSVQQGWKYYTKAQQCNGDYTFNKTLGLCYKIHLEAKTFLKAMDACEAEEAKLIIIRNEMEFLLVQGAVKGSTSSKRNMKNRLPSQTTLIKGYASDKKLKMPLTGLRKTLSNETIIWKWWNGQEESYLNWTPGKPDNKNGTENCMQIFPVTGYTYQYNDISCLTKESFICQKNI